MTRTGKRWLTVLGVVFGVLVVVIAAALFYVDRLLLAGARRAAAEQSAKLGRPITIADVRTKVLGGFGVRIEGIEVGAAEGESQPLFQLGHAEVEVHTGIAIASRGREIVVRKVETDGLTVNVIRLADGTTNIERLSEKLPKSDEAEPAGTPEQPKEQKDLSHVRVEYAGVVNSVIRFIDQSQTPAKVLAINDLDIEVRDLRAGAPLAVLMKAAILADKQNFDFRMDAAALPPTLVPTPVKVALKVEPIDLAPLAPFFPKSAGFQGGKVQADFNATLGGAVPGGEGQTETKGKLELLNMRFADAQGGAPLDVRFTTDVVANARAGDVDIRALELVLGPARIVGKGRATGLVGATPKMEGLELVAHNFDLAEIARYYPPLRKQLPGEIEGPIGMSLRAAGTQASPELAMEIDLTPVRLAIPEELTKAAGAPMRLTVTTRGGKQDEMAFQGRMDLAGADLRPGKNVNKGPGEPFAVDIGGVYKTAQDGTQRIELSECVTQVLDDRMTARGFYEKAKNAQRFDFALSSKRLDLDRMLIESDDKDAKDGKASKPGEAAEAETKAKKNKYAGLSGKLSMDIDSLKTNKTELRDMVGRFRMAEDLLTIETFTFRVFGGQISASGTEMRLADKQAPFKLKAEVKGLDMEPALATRTPKRTLAGKLDARFDLASVGWEKASMMKTVSGEILGQLADGVFHGKDLIGGVQEPLAKALPFKVPGPKSRGGTTLGDVPFKLVVENGKARLKEGIKLNRPEGAVTMDGGFTFDGELDLRGTVELAPATIQAMTGGKVTPDEPVPLGYQLTGPAWSPALSGVDAKPAAQVLAKHAAKGALKSVLGDKAKKIEGVLGGKTEDVEAAKREAEARVAAERAKAEEAARQQAERAKQQAAEKAKQEGAKKLRGLFGQ